MTTPTQTPAKVGHTPGQADIHTPVPFRLDESGFTIHGPESPDKPLVIVADLHGIHPGVSHYERRANAAFIVRACNAHADLLAALEALVSKCEANKVSGPALNAARAALALAKGGAKS